jgi:hypothetical protein
MGAVGQRVASNVFRIGEGMNRPAQVELDERTQALRVSAKHVSELLPPKGERLCQSARRGKVASHLPSGGGFYFPPQTSSAPGSSNPFSQRVAGISPVGPTVATLVDGSRTPKQVLLQASAATALRSSAMSHAEKENMLASESSLVPSPNNRIERGRTHKVLRRGRSATVLEQVLRARVREALACARSCERWATGRAECGSDR